MSRSLQKEKSEIQRYDGKFVNETNTGKQPYSAIHTFYKDSMQRFLVERRGRRMLPPLVEKDNMCG